jgi:CRISPR-associated endoribonuclease Cas6
MPRLQKPQSIALKWPLKTELVVLELLLQPRQDLILPGNYATQLHSWFLDQVRRIDPILSAQLHDGQSEKPFTVSELMGTIQAEGRSLRFSADQTYGWSISALSQPLIEWMRQWLQSPPIEVNLRTNCFAITGWSFLQPPTTYAKLTKASIPEPPEVSLSFVSPTGFRRKGSHFALPLPFNVFQSYLRRWNDFSGQAIEADLFLAWVDESVIILRHHVRSHKVSAGKSGSVTGFTGAVQFGLNSKARERLEYVRLWIALGRLAPYCGTGHKTTFGLGQTRLGWTEAQTAIIVPTLENHLTQRIAELTERFTALRKRTGGDRAMNTATVWATILARRELGESLQAIAEDLEMRYETVKTYIKLARKALK